VERLRELYEQHWRACGCPSPEGLKDREVARNFVEGIAHFAEHIVPLEAQREGLDLIEAAEIADVSGWARMVNSTLPSPTGA